MVASSDNTPDYQAWLDKGAWTFHEACWLYFGCEPPQNPFDALRILPETAKPYCDQRSMSFFADLYVEMERQLLAGKIKSLGQASKGGPLFKPQVIVTWINHATNAAFSDELKNALFPQKGAVRESAIASKKKHQEAFTKIQEEQPGLSRDKEEAKMRELLSPLSFDRTYHRELRDSLNKKPGRPPKKSER